MKSTRSIVALLVALACAALLAAGCGGPSKAEYTKEMKKVGEDVKALDKLGDSGAPTAKDLEAAEKTLDEAADKVEDIDPPSDVKKTHEDLVDTLHDASDLIGEMAPILKQATEDPSKLSSDDMSKMTKLGEEAESISKRISKIEKSYTDKGYKIGLE